MIGLGSDKKKIFAFLGVKCSQNWQLSFLIIEKRIPTTPFSKSSSTLARLPMAHACRKLMMSPGAEFNLATRLVRWWAWSPTLSRSWSAKPSLSTWPPACCWRCLIYVGSPCPSYRPPPAPWPKKKWNRCGWICQRWAATKDWVCQDQDENFVKSKTERPAGGL